MFKERITVIENLEKKSWYMILTGSGIFAYISISTYLYLIDNSITLNFLLGYLEYIFLLILVFIYNVNKSSPDKLILIPTEAKFIFSNGFNESCKIGYIISIRHKSERYIIEKNDGGRHSYLLDKKQGQALIDWHENSISNDKKSFSDKLLN